MQDAFQPGEIVQHFRNGKHYRIIGRAMDTLTDRWQYVYQALYDDPELGPTPLFVREEISMLEEVDHEGKKVPRFQRVNMPQ